MTKIKASDLQAAIMSREEHLAAARELGERLVLPEQRYPLPVALPGRELNLRRKGTYRPSEGCSDRHRDELWTDKDVQPFLTLRVDTSERKPRFMVGFECTIQSLRAGGVKEEPATMMDTDLWKVLGAENLAYVGKVMAYASAWEKGQIDFMPTAYEMEDSP